MEKILTEKLWDYIVANNPELMFSLQENYTVMKYLAGKVKGLQATLDSLRAQEQSEYIILEICMTELTAELRPSRYQYLKGILDDDFPAQYDELRESGLMTYELVNMVEACAPIFERLAFSEANEHDEQVRYEIMGRMSEYLNELKTNKA